MADVMRVYPCDFTAYGECPKCPQERDCACCGRDVLFEDEDDPPSDECPN